MKPTAQQQEVIDAHEGNLIVEACPGSGKCLAAGTKVLRFDGEVVNVEDIVEGDLLMGPDSKPRRVLSTARGTGPLWRIEPVKGDAWVCNDVHVLTLVLSGTKYGDKLVDIPLNRYLAQRDRRPFSRAKLIRAGTIEFGREHGRLPIDPYFLGLLIGDGSLSGTPSISKPDPEVEREAKRQAEKWGLRLRIDEPADRCRSLHFAGRMGAANPLTDALRALGLWDCTAGEKFIPKPYKLAPASVRRELLAGLLDSDGHLTDGGYDWISKSRELADGLVFVCRSLGLAAYLTEKEARSQDGAGGTYYRVSISGDVSQIPCRIKRKKAAGRRQIKDVRRTAFDVTLFDPSGEFFGFTLDGDGRFLLGDFTITHNTATLVERCRALPDDETKLVLAFNKRAAEEFKRRLGCVSGSDVRTFHSFCFREVMANPGIYGYRGRPKVADKSLLRLMLEANAGQFMYRSPRTWAEAGWDEDFAKEAEHSYYDQDLLDAMPELGPVEALTARALLRYRRWLLDNEVITFDAMVRLVAENTQHLRPPAQHVMVDEYQDVDRFQYEIALALSRLDGVRSLAVVGDPNQRIYEWRGALANAFGDLRVALNGSSRTLPMTVNFRSVDEILNHAETICPVGMTGVRGPSEGSVAYVQRITDEPNREGAAAALLSGLSRAELTDAAILCRYNRDALKWQLQLARSGYPVYMLGAGDFWSARHVQMALKARELGAKAEALFGSEEWAKFAASRRFRDNPEKLEECKQDARWVISLPEADLATLRANVQHEGGLRISSIHRSKGLEWSRVMVWDVTQKLKDERFVYYVAATRARDQLILA